MGNLVLSVDIFGGIWKAITGVFSGVGSYLSTNFVPVADAAWTATANFVTSIPAFCVAHPGAIVFGAVGLIAGVKLAKVAVKGIKSLFKKAKAGIKSLFAREEEPAPQPVVEKKAEPAKAAAPAKAPADKAPAKKAAPAKNIVSPVQDYMLALSGKDNLQGYKDYRKQKTSVSLDSYTQTNNNPLYAGYNQPKSTVPTMSSSVLPSVSSLSGSYGLSMDNDFVMER